MSEIFMWAKKLSLERTSEGGGAIPVVTPVPAYTYYFSTGYCNSQLVLAPPSGPHPSARDIQIVSTQRTVEVYESSHYPRNQCRLLALGP